MPAEDLLQRYTAVNVAEKVVPEITNWYDIDSKASPVAELDSLQHTVHERGAVISWEIEKRPD